MLKWVVGTVFVGYLTIMVVKILAGFMVIL